MNRIEEQYLLAQVRQKNAAAAERLIDAHYQDAYRFAFCFCRSQCVAEDITQEAFVRVWQHLEKFNGLCRFKTWLFRIIYALFIDDQRRQRRAPFTVMPNDEPASPDHDMLDEIALQTIWQRLPEEQQQI